MVNSNELAALMVAHSVAIRAIPEKSRDVFEPEHKDKYPDGVVQYVPQYGREMLVVERRPKHAGMFLMQSGLATLSGVHFTGKRFYASLEEVIEDLRKLDAEKK